jgi:hypothetical protein
MIAKTIYCNASPDQQKITSELYRAVVFFDNSTVN